jgi:hypothetical protein
MSVAYTLPRREVPCVYEDKRQLLLRSRRDTVDECEISSGQSAEELRFLGKGRQRA